MSAVKKTDYLPEAATLDLWRVAENGDVNELASVLPRVRDINAQNEHGVTALMRAAQYGHLKMVRALLDHGADANLKRNDKFTALALAAFFGHTEIVRVLMEHGADLQASTRHDTSPHMWATARTFNEVVDQLKKPASVPKPAPVARPAPVTKPAPIAKPAEPKAQEQVVAPPIQIDRPPTAAKPAVVRTLSDPPEIWDLVHEVPRGFNPRSAFLTRLTSLKGGWVFRTAAAVVLIGAGVAGVMLLRGVQARNDGPLVAPAKQQPLATMSVPSTTTTSANISQPATVEPSASAATSLAPIESSSSTTDAPIVNRKPGARWSRGGSRAERDLTRQVAASETVEPLATPVAQANTERRSDAQPKTSAPLSPQLIAPAKSATPKGKVIQWP
ncbi:MAG TPA: ankyrin repeat domain-containing protein [Pyrinomonadaceae bacterium]